MALRFYKDYNQCLSVFSLLSHSSYMSCLQFRFKYYKQCILDGFRVSFLFITVKSFFNRITSLLFDTQKAHGFFREPFVIV